MDPCERVYSELFPYDHLPQHLRDISKLCHDLAKDMLNTLPHNQELTLALRKLWEAKNLFVMAKLVKVENE